MDFKLTEEQKQIVASLDEVGKDVFAKKAARWDENHEYPWENIHQLREMGVLGMTIPKAYGGQASPLIDAEMRLFIEEYREKFQHVEFVPEGLTVEETVAFAAEHVALERVPVLS